jgi:hypothetical protein
VAHEIQSIVCPSVWFIQSCFAIDVVFNYLSIIGAERPDRIALPTRLGSYEISAAFRIVGLRIDDYVPIYMSMTS